MHTQIDTEQLKESTNILNIVGADLGPAVKQSGEWHFWCCPFHGERTPSFGVNIRTNTWFCFGACSMGGDAINYVMKYKHLEFRPACDYIAQYTGELPTLAWDAQSVRPKREPKLPASETAQWQKRAREIVKQCHSQLFQDSLATDALTWVKSRGLSSETIKSANLGYTPGWSECRTRWGLPLNGYQELVIVNQGILIPWWDGDLVKRITIRSYPLKRGDSQKHKIVTGSANLLYNLDIVDGSRPVVLVEGVFDALSIQQEAGDLVHVVATGGTSGAHTPQCIATLSAAPLVLVAFDADSAGDNASNFWTITLPKAKRWRPVIFKDPSEMLEKGGNLRHWIEVALK